VQRNSSGVVLPLAQHQCTIHCKRSLVAHGASKRKWVLQITHHTSKGVQKRSTNETELTDVAFLEQTFETMSFYTIYKKQFNSDICL